MAEIEAHFAGSATTARVVRPRLAVGRLVTGRALVRVGAVLLALLGVAALVLHPAGRTRAEANVSVRAPLVVGDVVGAILGRAGGAQVTAHGRVVTISFLDAHRDVARARVGSLARAGLEGAQRQVIASQTKLAAAARADRAQSAAQIASIASRTRITDPESAYQQRVRDGQDLEAQRAAAVAAGQPLTSINGAIADNQEAVFELQLQVTRHTELVAALNAADGRAIAATQAIASAQREVGSASVAVTDHATGGATGLGVAAGVAALVIAAIALAAAGVRRPRRVEPESVAVAAPVPPGPPVTPSARLPWVASEPAAVQAEEVADPALAEAEQAALESCGRRDSRYLEFYRALEPSSPPAPVVSPSTVDLVEAEARERAADHNVEPAEVAPEEPAEPTPQAALGE